MGLPCRIISIHRKVNLIYNLPWRHRGWVDVYLYAFFFNPGGRREEGWITPRPGPFTPSMTRVGSRISLDGCVKSPSPPTGFYPRTVQPRSQSFISMPNSKHLRSGWMEAMNLGSRRRVTSRNMVRKSLHLFHNRRFPSLFSGLNKFCYKEWAKLLKWWIE